MMPTTPSGTRTRSMIIPFGRVQRSVTTPTGSASARTPSIPSAMAATRWSSRASRSRKAAFAPEDFASARSCWLAAMISDRRARIAAAMAESAASLRAVGASASARAASLARCPISCRRLEMSLVLSTVFSGALISGFPSTSRFLARPRHGGELLPRPISDANDEMEKRAHPMRLKNQVSVVTGAGRNIGEEIAKLFAAEGAAVAIVDLDKARGERVANAIKANGGQAELFVADVSKGNEVAALVDAVVARFGRVDILVNNVAISDNKHIFDISEEEWDRGLAVTLKSQVLIGKHVR